MPQLVRRALLGVAPGDYGDRPGDHVHHGGAFAGNARHREHRQLGFQTVDLVDGEIPAVGGMGATVDEYQQAAP